MRIVVDTNVLVAALLNANGTPASILNAVLDGVATVLVDDRIVGEYREVLSRPKFGFPHEVYQPLLEFFEHHGEYVTPGPLPVATPDPADVAFYEVAVAGAADYLVTGNATHFPNAQWIVSPRRLVEVMRGER